MLYCFVLFFSGFFDKQYILKFRDKNKNYILTLKIQFWLKSLCSCEFKAAVALTLHWVVVW